MSLAVIIDMFYFHVISKFFCLSILLSIKLKIFKLQYFL